MQCYEYLAMQRYARVYLGNWTEGCDDLDLAEKLDEQDAEGLSEMPRLRAHQSPGADP